MDLPKIVAAGIYDSKIAIKNMAVSKKRKTSMFEIDLPIGDGGISYVNNDSFTISENMIICAKPNQQRYTKTPFKCYYVHMIVHDGPVYEALTNLPSFLETEKHSTYERILKRIIKHFDVLSDTEDFILGSLILELVYTLSKDAKKNLSGYKASNTNSMIERAIEYINENLTQDLSLQSVSKELSVSPIYFHNVFKTSVSKTLRDYVEQQRIKKAINLLQTTNLTLTQIAFECGFSSQSYFSYVFKRRMKQSPREYIKELYKLYEI